MYDRLIFAISFAHLVYTDVGKSDSSWSLKYPGVVKFLGRTVTYGCHGDRLALDFSQIKKIEMAS